jgi:hypothetical protein
MDRYSSGRMGTGANPNRQREKKRPEQLSSEMSSGRREREQAHLVDAGSGPERIQPLFR